MRRAFLITGFAGAALAAATIVLLPPLSSAENKEVKPAETSKSSTAQMLPITQVVLFSSGVGYFQREGKVEDSQRVDLSFDVRDINDLIKSLTLRDLDGGHISAISYDSNAPIDRTLKSFAVNLTGNPTQSALLNQARGEKVEVVLAQAAAGQPATLTGSLLGVENKRVAVGKDIVEAECLNLWCADGLRSVRLAEVQRVRFLNALMDSEMKKALETLALSHDTQKKAVSIKFEGKGTRKVQVGYVVENPLWKTSYRLVLGNEKKEEKPFLQGWAVVENPSDEDWNAVRMALISGRPISFQMNLYDPLFITRPTVEPELFASLRPVTYSGGFGGEGGPGGAPKPGTAWGAMEGKERQARTGGARFGNKDGKADADKAPDGAYRQNEEYALGLRKKLNDQMNLAQGVSSAATAAKLGDYFQYAIDHPVTLPRQKSALLPIVNKAVGGERVSIYNENTHPKFPLLGLVFHNTSGSHLMQGPLTVYEGSNYAGDARILDLQKGEKRLLSYAIDLGTEVQAIPNPHAGHITAVKIVRGLAHTNTRFTQSKTYKVANRNDVERTLLLEHPNRTDFRLTSKDKPWESAADVHRFQVKVPAGKTLEYTVSEEKDLGSSVSISNSNDQSIRLLINEKVTSVKVKEALRRALELKHKVALARQELARFNRQLGDLERDQERLRKNLKEMPATAKAYERYLKKFDDQETDIEKLQTRVKELQDAEVDHQKTLDAFLANLSVE